ncbi:hypothetical protein FRX31_005013, partial [Thalictrum thalictroides]
RRGGRGIIRNNSVAVKALNGLNGRDEEGTAALQNEGEHVRICKNDSFFPEPCFFPVTAHVTRREGNTPTVSFSESNDRVMAENHRIGQGEREITNYSASSAPPGFRQEERASNNSNIMTNLMADCCRVRSGSEQNNWISTEVRHIVEEMGVSSNQGKDAVEKFFFELGMRQLKAKRVVDQIMNKNYATMQNQTTSLGTWILLNGTICHVECARSLQWTSQSCVKTLIRFAKADVIFIQKTKIQEFKTIVDAKLFGEDWEWLWVPSIGFSG